MKLPFINEDIFKPHKSLSFFFFFSFEKDIKSLVERREPSFIYIKFIYIKEKDSQTTQIKIR